MAKRFEFSRQRFALGEGVEDAAFTRALILARGLQAFDVSATIDVGGVQGNSGFKESAIASEPVTGFLGVLDVAILADNDDDPAAAFQNVCSQIEAARTEGNLSRSWGRAQQPGVKAVGDPSVSVWMWPAPGQPGCLETLLWTVAVATHPTEAKCAEGACKCSGADGWPISKRDKARVRCFLALTCRSNPGLPLSLLWRDRPDLIPLSHTAFDPIASFLATI